MRVTGYSCLHQWTSLLRSCFSSSLSTLGKAFIVQLNGNRKLNHLKMGNLRHSSLGMKTFNAHHSKATSGFKQKCKKTYGTIFFQPSISCPVTQGVIHFDLSLWQKKQLSKELKFSYRQSKASIDMVFNANTLNKMVIM